ncbi:type II toxin-antitoxin system PemK/MazF family toxin [Demequina sp. SYSU T00192]|uniref:mRNA interferase n=1 Tax=Demequina litoralis TaxID=3051660 RepID=A0ABT8G7J1_9MICO|nr:type II toxin-antitoxin system PemK/MazF family toxin [Demequina sp. SYSU T00192]MDN4475032.1 type II toxin-antitoxin system PemK/MazF family toxin [Demequina sp. SYSU T00192]
MSPEPLRRGAVCWADLGPARGSASAHRRPVLVVQADAYNRSRLRTVAVLAITGNTALAELPGNVFLPADVSGLPRDSCVNVTAVTAVDREALDGEVVRLPPHLTDEVDRGLCTFLAP